MIIRKKFRVMGSSYGIVIPKLVLESLKINPILHDVDIEVLPDGLKITKAEKED